jgi:hypothetical protein
MSRYILAVILVVISISICFGSMSEQDYIDLGRSQMFGGTFTGLRQAWGTFDDALNDPECPGCQSNDEIHFLHAALRTAMVIGRDDGGELDSVFEILDTFGLNVVGDSLDPNDLDITMVTNSRACYEIPEGSPDVNEFGDLRDDWLLPELDAIVVELEMISDTPERFRIFFTPAETGLMNNLEVDYGEVLILKGCVKLAAAKIRSGAAYDLNVDSDDQLFEKWWGEVLDFNSDVLSEHPEFLKILPTANDSNDGVAVLAAGRSEFIESLDYFLMACDYIVNEDVPAGTDVQDNELLYVDANNATFFNNIRQRIVEVRDSLVNDTECVLPVEVTRYYSLSLPGSGYDWQLGLTSSGLGLCEGGFLRTNDPNCYGFMDVDWFEIEGDEVGIELECFDSWCQGYIEGNISGDSNSVSNLVLNIWGDKYGTFENLAGSVECSDVNNMVIDMNPVFGQTARYPEPVSLRDLLPEFDEFGFVRSGTVGSGLGYDATLGGIRPGKTQRDWAMEFGLQPGGQIWLSQVSPLQVGYSMSYMYSYVQFWFEGQRIFSDYTGDVEDENHGNGDIDEVYMGFDDDNIYGAIFLNDPNGSMMEEKTYFVYFSPVPDEAEAFGSIRFEIKYSAGWCNMNVYKKDQMGMWMSYAGGSEMPHAQYDGGVISFTVGWNNLPGLICGKFMTFETSEYDSAYCSYFDGDENSTRLQIMPVTSISGRVIYSGGGDGPVYVKACSDFSDLENSVVAETLAGDSGEFTLENIGMGFDGYIWAYVPAFGFGNPFEDGGFIVEAVDNVSVSTENVTGFEIEIESPEFLADGGWVDGTMNQVAYEYSAGMVQHRAAGVDYYYFDAVADVNYTMDFNCPDSGCEIYLYGRDGDKIQGWYWVPSEFSSVLSFSKGGKYFISVGGMDDYMYPEAVDYKIRVTGEVSPIAGDVASEEGVGIKDLAVDSWDLAAVAECWLERTGNPLSVGIADADGNGIVDFADFALVTKNWSQR